MRLNKLQLGLERQGAEYPEGFRAKWSGKEGGGGWGLRGAADSVRIFILMALHGLFNGGTLAKNLSEYLIKLAASSHFELLMIDVALFEISFC